MQMKYVMLAGVSQSGIDLELPFIFPFYIVHADMRRLLERHRDLKDKKIVSAGFIRLTETGELEAYGESDSLGIESRPQDTLIIKEQALSWETSLKNFYGR